MKTSMKGRMVTGLMLSLLLSLSGCTELMEKGTLEISLDPESFDVVRKAEDLPDLSSFLLEVVDAKGKKVYGGKFGEAPDKMLVAPGSYEISIRSRRFSKPSFSTPQYGDDQMVVVSSGENVEVVLKCVMVNAGIRLRMGPDFLAAYPRGILFVESEGGKLNYNYSERRVAYFPAGKVTVFLEQDGKRKDLFTRVLKEREVLDVKLVAPNNAASGKEVSVVLDTSKFWIDERFAIGGGSAGGGTGSGGGQVEDALSVGMALLSVGKKDVWVYGYIVGCMSGARLVLGEPFPLGSNIVIGSNRYSDERESCLAVELRKKELREALNLMDHPEMLGRKVYIKGDLVDSYYGDAGIKSAEDFRL